METHTCHLDHNELDDPFTCVGSEYIIIIYYFIEEQKDVMIYVQ